MSLDVSNDQRGKPYQGLKIPKLANVLDCEKILLHDDIAMLSVTGGF